MKLIMHTALTTVLLAAFFVTASAQKVTTATSFSSVNSATPATAGDGRYFYTADKEIKAEDLKSKEVSKEISTPKGADIYIENSSRGLVIKTWDQSKVKVTTTVYYDGKSEFTDEEWLERINLSLKMFGGAVKIKSGTVGGNGAFNAYSGLGYSYNYNSGVAVFDGNGQNIKTSANIKRIVTITVPAGSKLDVETKYSDVQLPAGIGDASVDISNGNLEAENINKLVLRSKYSNVNVGDIKTAELEFNNGRFSARNIDDLDIESKYSTIEMATSKKIMLRSINDEYEIEDAGEVRGHKNYGNLRITRLKNLLDIEGSNADIKVRNVEAGVSLIKLDNKYADIRMPLRNTKDYSVDFSGIFSSVYGNFEKVPVAAPKEKEKATLSSSNKIAGSLDPVAVTGIQAPMVTIRSSDWGGQTSNGPSRFTATVGSGKGLKIDIKCMNCTVDFK